MIILHYKIVFYHLYIIITSVLRCGLLTILMQDYIILKQVLFLTSISSDPLMAHPRSCQSQRETLTFRQMGFSVQTYNHKNNIVCTMLLKSYQTGKKMFSYYVSLSQSLSQPNQDPNNDCFQQSHHYNICPYERIDKITRGLHIVGTQPTRSNDDLRPVYVRQFVTIARGPNLGRARYRSKFIRVD